jgi:hypothetical protein
MVVSGGDQKMKTGAKTEAKVQSSVNLFREIESGTLFD